MKILIVDDAPQARTLLRLMLSELRQDLTIVGEAENAEEARSKIALHRPDLVLLDIEMPGKSGLQLLEELNVEKSKLEVILVTAYNQYAVQAFRLSATDYLLKPIRKAHLEEALGRVQDRLQAKQAEFRLKALLHNLKTDQGKILCITINYGYEYIPLEHIQYLEAGGAYTVFHLKDGKSIMVSKNLKHYETILCDLPNFARLNRSFIVRLPFVKAFKKEDRGVVVLHDGTAIKLSDHCAAAFFDKMRNYTP